MPPFVRMLLVVTALLASGAVQAAVARGNDACCADERGGDDGAPCPDCPPGLACACCAVRGAVQGSVPELRPAAAHATALALATSEPALDAAAGDIFRPPRA